MSWSTIIGQSKQKAVLQRAVQTNRLPNGYLFLGAAGAGKEATALEVARVLNCDAPAARTSAEACGVCESCKQMSALAHPNLELVFPVERIVLEKVAETGKDREKQDDALDRLKALYDEKRRNPYFTMKMDKAMGILTDQIEELVRKSQFKPMGDKKRVYIISQAELMNTEAQNRLLKSLEEPPPYVLYILVSSQPEMLLPTILSRCQQIRFSALSAAEIESGLTASGTGAPEERKRFAALAARGNFAEAMRLASDDAALVVRNNAVELLQFALSGERDLDLIRKIEEVTKRDESRETQLRLLSSLLVFLEDAVKVQAGGAETKTLTNVDLRERIVRFTKSFPNSDFERAAAETEKMSRAIARNANALLALTALMLRLRALLRR